MAAVEAALSEPWGFSVQPLLMTMLKPTDRAPLRGGELAMLWIVKMLCSSFEGGRKLGGWETGSQLRDPIEGALVTWDPRGRPAGK